MALVDGILTLAGVISACVGLGLAGQWLAERERSAIPLAWATLAGLAFLTSLAGWPVLAGVYSRKIGLALLVLGIAAGLACRGRLRSARVREPSEGASEWGGAGFGAAGFAALALLLAIPRAVGALHSPIVDWCDDWPSYFHFPKLLLESGGFVEPFNFRRLGALGAGPFLQSYLWPAWGTASTFLADATFGQLALWSCARAAAAQPGHGFDWRREVAGLAAVAAGFAIPVTNSAPVLLPTAGAVALLGLSWKMSGGESGRASVALAGLWGLVAAWLIGLRTSNVVFPAILWLAGAAAAGRRRDLASLRASAIAALALGLALLPWCLASWVSSGTPFFPLIRGHFRSPSLLSAPIGSLETAEFVGRCLWGSRAWLLVLVAACVAAIPSLRTTALHSVLAVLGTLVLSAVSLTASDTFNVARYTAPFLFAGILFLAGVWLAHASEPAGRQRWRALLALGGLAVWLVMPAPLATVQSPIVASYGKVGWRVFWAFVDASQRAAENGGRARAVSGAEHFAEAQRRLGDDARIVSAVSKSFEWGFERHVVHTLDCVGQVSPPPGMPFFRGPEPLVRYFRDLGYTHLAFTPPETTMRTPGVRNCLYSRVRWEYYARLDAFLWRVWAPYFLDFFENVEELRRSYRLVYQGPGLVVVDLRERVSP